MNSKKFFNERASQFGESLEANYSDTTFQDLEDDTIKKFIWTPDTIEGSLLDVGCGNGHKLEEHGIYFTESIGIDTSEKMVDVAKQRGLNVQVASAIEIPFPDDFFDCVIACRTISNILGREDQRKSLLEIHRVMKPDGQLILIEAWKEERESMNKMRKSFGLGEIPIAWHNTPFDHYMSAWIFEQFRCMEIVKFGLYFFITRILHPLLVWPENPKHGAFINKLAVKISSQLSVFDEISIIKLYLLEKE